MNHTTHFRFSIFEYGFHGMPGSRLTGAGRISRPGRIAIMLLTTVLFFAVSTEAWASGGDRKGTAGADQLLVPVGARGIALGNSYLAGMTGIQAVYYNPAGLAGSTASADLMFSHMSTFDNDGVSVFGVGGQFPGFGHLALTVKTFSFGSIANTDERHPDGTGGTFSPAFVTIGLTYARALTDRIRAGITGYLVSEDLNRVSATSAAFDIGVQYHGLAGVDGLELGVALRHLGPNMTYDGPGLYRNVNEIGSDRDGQLLKIEAAGAPIPTSLELGMAYRYRIDDIHSVSVIGAFENNNYLDDQYKLAAEYSYRDFVFVRGSYSITGEKATDSFGDNAYLFGPAFGVGLRQDVGGMSLLFDYAYRTNAVLTGNHVFTLGVTF
jgi:hypothetical protein